MRPPLVILIVGAESYPFPSGFVTVALVPILETLPFLESGPMISDVLPSSALRSRNPAQRSASDSLPDVDEVSEKNSVLNEGVLGVRWKGEAGRRNVLCEAPGRARPACSFCSSVHARYPAITCKIWNRFGSDRSIERN